MENMFKVKITEFRKDRVLLEEMFSETPIMKDLEDLAKRLNAELKDIITIAEDRKAWEYGTTLVMNDLESNEVVKYSMKIIYNDSISVNMDSFDKDNNEFRAYVFTSTVCDYDSVQDVVIIGNNIEEAYEIAEKEFSDEIDLVDIRAINKNKMIHLNILNG